MGRKRHAPDTPPQKPGPSTSELVKAALAEARKPEAAGKTRLLQTILEGTIERAPDGKRPKFKKPKHGSNNAGKVLHPNARAAIEINRLKTPMVKGKKGPIGPACSATAKHSGKPCQLSRVRGTNRCHFHGGLAQKERNLQAKYADYKPDRGTVAKATLKHLTLAGGLPLELIRDVPAFAAAYAVARRGVNITDPDYDGFTYAQRRRFFDQAVVLVLRFLAAWEHVQQNGDLREWSECMRVADQMGFGRVRGGD